MRKTIPHNNVSFDYEKVLKEFISQLKEKTGNALTLVYLTGSYARGDATDRSDLDVFCIFDHINQSILETVGFCARNTSVSYDLLEINTQSMSLQEYKSKTFENWSEYAVVELNSVLLYGEELVSIHNLKDVLALSYKKNLADTLMGVRHYICVDEPKEKLTHSKITTYILKPLMFALRQERFCTTGIYPLSTTELLNSYTDETKILVEYFMNKEKFDFDILKNHREVLNNMHNLIKKMIEVDYI